MQAFLYQRLAFLLTSRFAEFRYTNFVVVSSTHYLTVDFESLLGVRVNVTCPTETVVWNGEEIKEGSYSYTITKTNG